MGRGVQMKIIVLGAYGMAGHIISAYLKECGHDVVGITRDTLNIENESGRNKFFYNKDLSSCDFIINCVGVLGPNSNENPARTIFVNSYFPHYLEFIYSQTSTRVIHISTDCIFNGERGYYIESDLPNETNFYGRSKALGELNNDKDLTLRMSIIGTEIKEKNRSGLLNWVTTNPDNKIYGWEKAIWNGITTFELARQINNYIRNPSIAGIYHLVPDYTITKYDLVQHINEVFDCNKEVVPIPGKAENKSLLDTRNEYRIFTRIPNYREQLLDLRDFSESL